MKSLKVTYLSVNFVFTVMVHALKNECLVQSHKLGALLHTLPIISKRSATAAIHISLCSSYLGLLCLEASGIASSEKLRAVGTLEAGVLDMKSDHIAK